MIDKRRLAVIAVFLLAWAALLALIIMSKVINANAAPAAQRCNLNFVAQVPYIKNVGTTFAANDLLCQVDVTTSDGKNWSFYNYHADGNHVECLPATSTYMVCAGGFGQNWGGALTTYPNPATITLVKWYTQKPTIFIPFIKSASRNLTLPYP